MGLPILGQAQGFGGFGSVLGKKKEATLTLKLPAAVNLNQKRIKVVASVAREGIPKDLVPILKTKLVTAIQKDPRFILDDRNPETELGFTITNYYVEGRNYPATKDSPAYTLFSGKIEASYQALEVGTEAPLDSENLSFIISPSGPEKPTGIKGLLPGSRPAAGTKSGGSENEARDALIEGLVTVMSQRATPHEENIMVPLPGGKLEPLSSLAMSQRWPKLLEDAEKTDALPKTEDDSYRLYLIGLANEALAYQDANDAEESEKARRGDVTSEKAKQALAQEDKDFTEASTYLDKAAKAYKDAMQAKPSEKDYRAPDARIEQAVRLYATISRHKQEYAEAVERKKAEHVATVGDSARSASVAGGGQTGSTSGSAFNQVISMCQDHVQDIGQLVKDHPTELRFERTLTLSEELRVKKECGGESKGILEAVKAQVPASKPVTAKKQ
ncbi:MAG TPA: hypothetical protein VLY24_22405 [Bryobacteraceae bacterium]|nr:hypothetical protein [Bryobacteraceae bacterium]